MGNLAGDLAAPTKKTGIRGEKDADLGYDR